MKKPVDAKTTMLAHSEAKVEFFKKYLERYLRILYFSEYIEEICIFDVFSGTGIYDNGKKGSPIVAFDAIKNLREERYVPKKISLIINDSASDKVASVQSYISNINNNHCDVKFHTKNADDMFKEIIHQIATQPKTTRNLIFIDPYGYKEIKKSTLVKLLENQRTEIILFLPISQMQRFTTVAIESDLKPYEPLKEFVYSFFEGEHPIKRHMVKAMDYIGYLKEALAFNEYFSASYYIERDESSFYCLFFISPHIYGIQKILEVKWQLDEDEGGGFKQPQLQSSFFDAFEKEQTKNDNYSKLESFLKNSLITPKTNNEIYEMILRQDFLPKHAVEIFKKWQDDNPNFKVLDYINKEPARKNSFYLGWDHYKTNTPKVIFILK